MDFVLDILLPTIFMVLIYAFFATLLVYLLVKMWRSILRK